MINGVKFAKNVAEILLSEVSDIDLILLYGAFAQGRGHPRSDYDMIAISDTKTIDWKFVLDGVPVNLWSMTWEEAKDLILGKDGRFWSIGASSLAKSIVIYSKDADMLSKLNNLVLRVTEGGKSALKQAIERFDYTYGLLWRLKQSIELSNLLEVRILKWDLFNELNCALSAVNKKYFLNNWGKQFQELSTFDLLPENYISRVKNFIVSKPEEALEIGSKLVEDVKILLKQLMRMSENEVNLQDFTSAWCGVIEYLNKSKSAEDEGNLFAGLYAACDNAEFFLWAFQQLQNEIWKRGSFYSVQEALFNLNENTSYHIRQLLNSQNLKELSQSTEFLSNKLKSVIIERGLELPEAESIDNCRKFIKVNSI